MKLSPNVSSTKGRPIFHQQPNLELNLLRHTRFSVFYGRAISSGTSTLMLFLEYSHLDSIVFVF